jgi:Fe-S-cluster containining protein
MNPDREMAGLAALEALYREVDGRSAQLGEWHAERLQCRLGCTACCVDDIKVFDLEAANIRRHHDSLLEAESPHAPGACAFLDEAGACRIYAQRPYVCRTQGLPLRWLDEGSDGEPIELRDICPLNEAGPPLEQLPEERCWSIGEFEGRLAELQRSASGGNMHRVALRALFQEPGNTSGSHDLLG